MTYEITQGVQASVWIGLFPIFHIRTIRYILRVS